MLIEEVGGIPFATEVVEIPNDDWEELRKLGNLDTLISQANKAFLTSKKDLVITTNKDINKNDGFVIKANSILELQSRQELGMLYFAATDSPAKTTIILFKNQPTNR